MTVNSSLEKITHLLLLQKESQRSLIQVKLLWVIIIGGILLQKLEKCVIKGNILNWFKSYLS